MIAALDDRVSPPARGLYLLSSDLPVLHSGGEESVTGVTPPPQLPPFRPIGAVHRTHDPARVSQKCAQNPDSLHPQYKQKRNGRTGTKGVSG
jgi:hypothetical protein